MGPRWKKLCCTYFLLLIFAPALYLFGVFEWLMATSIDNFSWPLEFDADKLMRDYRSNSINIQPINKANFKFTILPREACREYKMVTVLIKTRVEDLYNRDVLRRTWIQALIHQGHRYAFLVGKCERLDKDCEDSLNQESVTHHDILQADFLDTYRNNTYKTNMGLRYVTNHCVHENKTSYLLLIDGDYALNIYNLEAYIRHIHKPDGLYCGHTWWNSKPYRTPFSKHYLPLSEYPYDQFPPYVSGGTILLSIDVVQKFYVTSQYTKHFAFDDIFYGILAKKLGITPTDTEDLLPSLFNVPKPRDHQNMKTIGSHRTGNLYDVEHIYREYGQKQYLYQKDFVNYR